MANGIVNVSEIKADYITSKTGGDLTINSTVKGTGFINVSAGAGDAGKVPKLNANGLIDASMLTNGTINHTTLLNIGTNTHAQIDSHIADASNPHNVTAAQVGSAAAQWNASKIQGVNISATAPLNNDFLKYDATTGQWIPYRRSTAAMYFVNNATTTATTTLGLPVKAAGSYLAEELVDFNHVAGTLTYTGASAKKFMVNAQASLVNATAGMKMTIYIIKDGIITSPTTNKTRQSTSNTATVDSYSIGNLAFFTLATNSTIQLFISNDDGTTLTTVVNLYLSIVEL